jgi:hypothetical protein
MSSLSGHLAVTDHTKSGPHAMTAVKSGFALQPITQDRDKWNIGGHLPGDAIARQAIA